MRTHDTIIRDLDSAAGYDGQALKTNWLGPQVVFGLTYEFVKPGETVLDLGIGSGLSSILFHHAGLKVYGLDGSSEILQVCAAKGFALDLKLHDLRDLPLPYPSEYFNHVLCVSVLNSFPDLAPLFGEVSRIIKPLGIFAFTVEEQEPGQADRYAINRVNVEQGPQEESAVMLFRHSEPYISRSLSASGFTVLRMLEFVAFHYPAENRGVLFKVWIAQKRK